MSRPERGRSITCSAQPFTLAAGTVMAKELEILGSRYVTRQEVMETLAIVARRDVWPVVTEVVPLADAEALHDRIERGASDVS